MFCEEADTDVYRLYQLLIEIPILDVDWKWQLKKEQLGSRQEKQVVMHLNDLEVALREVTKKLTTCERVLRVATPVGPESGKLPSNHYVSATH